jgi:hypothetical protein
VGRDSAFDRVAGQAPAGTCAEQRVWWSVGSLVQPRGEDRLGRGGQRDSALLSAFAFAADVCAGAERDVAAVQADQLGDAKAGLDREREQRAIAATFLARSRAGRPGKASPLRRTGLSPRRTKKRSAA